MTEINNIAIHYLKSKSNYVYFTSENIEDVLKLSIRDNEAMLFARDNMDNLYPSSYYFIDKYEGKNNIEIDSKKYIPRNAKSYKTFNKPIDIVFFA